MVWVASFFLPQFLLLSLSLSKPTWAGVVPDKFIEEVVTNTRAMSGTFVPNPRNGNKPMMILTSKNGQINVLEDPDESPDSIRIMDLSDGDTKMCTNGERGLHTVIPSPNFAKNRHLFAFFTKYREECLEDPKDGPHNVVMRFTMDPETLMLDYNEGTLIFRGPPTDERMHNGGAMAFGNDGKLYVTTGDAGQRPNAGPLENGTVPDDNPFTKASGYANSYRCADTKGRVPEDAPNDSYCSEVWANGLRNPFRIDMDPNEKDKVKFSVGDLGAAHIESIYYGGTDYKGTNYGWPIYEGVCKPGSVNIENCKPNDDPSITMPFHWYEHNKEGGCIGGQVHVPEGIWPPEFKFLFIDFVFKKIYSLQENRPQRACAECSPPLPPTRNQTFYRSIQEDGENGTGRQRRLLEMWFGPYKDTQALYFTKFGNHNSVTRIRYNGIVNKPPNPAFDFNYNGGTTVEFDASGTSDPEGDELEYEWDFGDDSALRVDETIVSHQYEQLGEYVVTLKVTDTSGQEQQVSKIVKIGTAPKVTILLPYEGKTFWVGQTLRLKGEAVDFLGNPIPDEQLTWEVRLHHANHFHPFLDRTDGNDFDLYEAPAPEDYLAAKNSFLKVVLTARDKFGLSETVSVDVQPHKVKVNITTQPTGLDVVIDGYSIQAPQTITLWKRFKLPVTVVDQPPYKFKKWSDGRSARTRKFAIYQKPGDPRPEVRPIFCSDLGTICENHDECCSGDCNDGMCVPRTSCRFVVCDDGSFH